jgi:hypothetical protein
MLCYLDGSGRMTDTRDFLVPELEKKEKTAPDGRGFPGGAKNR